MRRWHILSVFFFMIGGANLVRAGIALYLLPALDGWDLSLQLPLLTGIYALWGIGFITASVLIWHRRGLRWALPLALLYQLSSWVMNLSAVRSDYARSLWKRDLLLSALFLGIVVALILKPKSGFLKKTQIHNRD